MIKYKKYIVEFIGTFFLVLTICMTTFGKVSADLQPLAIGLTLTVLIYSIGHISIGQFNPAVTLALSLRGKLPLKEAGFYIIVQVLGAISAVLLSVFLVSGKPLVAPFAATPPYFGIVQALIAELLGTFLLVWVILSIATSKALEGNNFYGLAIGFTFTAMIYTLGSVSGGAFNPAIAISMSMAQMANWNNIWIYLLGSFGGAALAALLYRSLHIDE